MLSKLFKFTRLLSNETRFDLRNSEHQKSTLDKYFFMCFCFNSVIHKGVPLIRQYTLKDPVPSDRFLCIVLCPMHLELITFPLLIPLNSRRNEEKRCQRRYRIEGIRCVPFVNKQSLLILSKN